MELDHVFICVDDPPAAERILAAFGLAFDLRAIHHGQGTANACAFFDNAYLELLGRHDDAALRGEAVRPLALWERVRWRETGASPFGVALRPDQDGIPPEAWPYEAPFLAPGGHIPILTPRHAAQEPLVFLVPPTLPIRLGTPAEHRGARRRLTGVRMSGPHAPTVSPALRLRLAPRVLVLHQAAAHHLELEWDDAGAGEAHDFQPALPLTLRW
jgi:hypothetical protein